MCIADKRKHVCRRFCRQNNQNSKKYRHSARLTGDEAVAYAVGTNLRTTFFSKTTILPLLQTKAYDLSGTALEHNKQDSLKSPPDRSPILKIYTCTKYKEIYEEVIIMANKITRIFGGSRYSTCLAVADELKAALGVDKFDSVVVASGADFPDALAGTYLAAVMKAPILLIADTHIDMIMKYIEDNIAVSGTIYILGSENTVSKKAADALSDIGTVKRLGGKSRYITNLRILEDVGITTGELLVVCATTPWDGLSVSSSGRPILLVNDKLRDDQKQFLATTSFSRITVIGSKDVIPETMLTELSAYCADVDRVFGSSRYKTTIEVAKYFYGEKSANVVLTCGTNFPDGLCSGVLANAKNAPVILTVEGRESLAAEYVKNYNIQSGYVVGSAKVVSDESARTVFGLAADAVIK